MAQKEATHCDCSQWEASAGSEGASASDQPGRPGLLERGGAALSNVVRRTTEVRGNNRRFSEEQAQRKEAFAAFCKEYTIKLLNSFEVANAEACVTSIDLPRFVLVLTGPHANLSLRKALWLASFLLYASPSGAGTITQEIFTSVLGHLGKVVGGDIVAYTNEELYEIMDLAGIQYSATTSRTPRKIIELGNLPGEKFKVPDVDAGFSFNYIITGEAASAIQSSKSVCMRILSNQVPNVQELRIPLIKGASGCGKTRLGREIAVGISEMASDQYQKAVHILRRMDIFPALHSQNFISGAGKVDGEAMLLANLVCLSEAVPDALRSSRTPSITFGLESFLVHAKTQWGIDMIVFQIDEYRRDLDGATAMMVACAQRLIAREAPEVAKVYPIITGMTSYVEVYDDAIGRSSAISGYPGIVPYFVRSLQGPARAHMEMNLPHFIADSAHDDRLVDVDSAVALSNVWWSQLMHDTGGHARYYKFVADAVSALGLASKVVSGEVTREDCMAISENVLGLLGSISNPANWRSLVARQLSLYDDADAECDIGAVADSAMRRFIALAITKCSISEYRRWRLMEVDGHTVCISLDVATHSGLIGYHPDAYGDAVVDISRLMIAALNEHSDTLRPAALSYNMEEASEPAAVVESFRMRLCASTTASPDEDCVDIDEARPVCVGDNLGLAPGPEWWDTPGIIKRVGRYAAADKDWPTDGSLPPNVYFRDPKYAGWCGVSYFHVYAEPAVTVVVLHLVTQRGESVGGQLDWAHRALQKLVSWQRLPKDRQLEVVVDIVFRVPTGTIELPAQLGTAKSAPIPITQGVGATAATATHDEYDIKERHKAAIASSLEDLQSYLQEANCLDSFQGAIEDAEHFSVKAITAAIASDYFPVRDIFEQR